MNYFWFKRSLKDAVTMPRVHDQLFPEQVFAEDKISCSNCDRASESRTQGLNTSLGPKLVVMTVNHI